MGNVWTMAKEIGYEPKTTFWQDFSIAESFGLEAVRDTYKRSFNDWKTNHVYLTELVMVLNHKIWYWFGKDEAMTELYNKLWEETDNYACANLKGEELRYFLKVID